MNTDKDIIMRRMEELRKQIEEALKYEDMATYSLVYEELLRLGILLEEDNERKE